mgnify:FL=1
MQDNAEEKNLRIVSGRVLSLRERLKLAPRRALLSVVRFQSYVPTLRCRCGVTPDRSLQSKWFVMDVCHPSSRLNFGELVVRSNIFVGKQRLTHSITCHPEERLFSS